MQAAAAHQVDRRAEQVGEPALKPRQLNQAEFRIVVVKIEIDVAAGPRFVARR
jgi:hypothetical protein